MDIFVQYTTINDIKRHPNADALDLAVVNGWQTVVARDSFKNGDRVVYVPPDSVVPTRLAEAVGVSKYLGKSGRVLSAKLRGEYSHGFVFTPEKASGVVDIEKAGVSLGDNVASVYGIVKYVPPVKPMEGDAESEIPEFSGYTDIRSLRDWPHIIDEHTLVYVTEKIHGANVGVGLIRDSLKARSHKVVRRDPGEDRRSSNKYWFALTLDPVNRLLYGLRDTYNSRFVTVFGEVFGPGVQSIHYGKKGLDFMAFDIRVNGRYLDATEFVSACDTYGVKRVPELFPFGTPLKDVMMSIREVTNGRSLVADNIMEGAVVRPITEKTDPRIGRVILKWVGDEYAVSRSKGSVSDTTDV